MTIVVDLDHGLGSRKCVGERLRSLEDVECNKGVERVNVVSGLGTVEGRKVFRGNGSNM